MSSAVGRKWPYWGYANLYNLEAGEQCWLGNVIVSPDYRGQDAALFLIRNMITAARH
ncbi:hypothetical protein [Paenibacillus monticola]|uniref:hypothetical protein n=1 Tax=Paenibacillus monticola TaxID=2666075 RepID=UPI00189F61D2|nr:hypothetical protein [Paenibacillus monticola]